MPEQAKWVSVDEVRVSGPHYVCTDVYHLLPNENGGRHNAFIWVYKNGQLVRDGSVSIEWGWEDMGSTKVDPQPCNKKLPNEPSCDITIYSGMKLWVKVKDGNIPSDVVRNMHTKMDGQNGNSLGHHSYNITFELIDGDDNQGEIVINPTPKTWEEGYTELRKRIEKLENK